MPPEAMAAMPMPAEAYSGSGAWGGPAGGLDDGIITAPVGKEFDPMGDPMGGAPMGGNPAFDGAMAAMDGAAAANMAEGMDAANTAADADEAKVDAEPGGGDVV